MENVQFRALTRHHPAIQVATPRERAAAAVGQRTRALVAVAAALSLLGYGLLLLIVKDLRTAEPSYAGEVFRGIPIITREAMARQDAASLRFLLALIGLFALYGFALRALAGRSSPWLERAVLAAGALFLFVQVLQPAMLSTDVYAYAMYGRLVAIYHADPYLPAQGDYWADPFYWLTYGLPWPSWYGPLWTLVSTALALAGGERVGFTVLLARGIAIVSALVSGGLILACLRRIAPARAAQGVALFLWNPLVVLETGLSGHNDAFMGALLLLGVWLYLRGSRLLPVAALVLSALVKVATIVVLPLYLALVAWRLPNWRARCRLLALAGGVAALVALPLFGLVRTGPNLPVVRSASAAYFYDNNVYQLIFPALRVRLGEPAETAYVPVHFYPWWATTERTVGLLRGPDSEARTLERVRGGTLLLVVSPDVKPWVRAYNPASGQQGYVPEDMLVKAERPEAANVDPILGRLERNPASWEVAGYANELLRSATWLAFAALFVVAAWRATTLRGFLVSSVAVLLAAYWLVATEFWPWYVIWALALAALVPTSRPTLLAVILSASALTLYLTIGYERTPQSWLFAYRSIPAFVLPLVVFALIALSDRGTWAAESGRALLRSTVRRPRSTLRPPP